MDIAKFYPTERVGIPDFTAVVGDLPLEEETRRNALIWLPAGRTIGTPSDARILGGFNITNTPVGGTSVVLNQGAAFCKVFRNSVLQHAVTMGAQNPSSYTLDFSAAGDATYAVWIRFVYSNATFENRVFWNSSGAPAQEFNDNVATREVGTWEAIFQNVASAAPGNGEYFKIYEVVISGSLITVVGDKRHFYFEGSKALNYEFEWGDGANDRSTDRATYPVEDMNRFVELIRRMLSDHYDPINAGPHHFKLPTLGLAQLDDEHLPDGHHGAIEATSILNNGVTVLNDSTTVNAVLTTNTAKAQFNLGFDASSDSRVLTNFEVLGQGKHGTLYATIIRPNTFGEDVLTLDANGFTLTQLKKILRKSSMRVEGDPSAAYYEEDVFGLVNNSVGYFESNCVLSNTGSSLAAGDFWQYMPGWTAGAPSGSPVIIPQIRGYGRVGANGGRSGFGVEISSANDELFMNYGGYQTLAGGPFVGADRPAMMMAFFSPSGLGTMTGHAFIRMGWNTDSGGADATREIYVNFDAPTGQITLTYNDGSTTDTVVLVASAPTDDKLYVVRLVQLSSSKWFVSVREDGIALDQRTYSTAGAVYDDTYACSPLILIREDGSSAGGPTVVFHKISLCSRSLIS